MSSKQLSSSELTPVSFTSREAWLNFHNPETDESLYMDVVTTVSIGDAAPIPCIQQNSRNVYNEKITTALLPNVVASRIGEFCTQEYDPVRYSPQGATFDCHSALQYWLGESGAVSLGVGTGDLREVTPESSGTTLGTVATGYVIRSCYPARLKHSYLGLGVDLLSPHSGENTLSVHDINGLLLLASPPTILHAYGGGIVKRLARN